MPFKDLRSEIAEMFDELSNWSDDIESKLYRLHAEELASIRAKRAENPETFRIREQIYRDNHRPRYRELTRERSRKYRLTHKRKQDKESISTEEWEMRKNATRKWQANNREHLNEYHRKRRAAGLEKRTYNDEQYAAQLKRCAKWAKKNRQRITDYERERRRKKKQSEG